MEVLKEKWEKWNRKKIENIKAPNYPIWWKTESVHSRSSINSSRISTKRSILRYIIIKVLRIKDENILKVAREKWLICTRDPQWEYDHFYFKIIEERRQWDDIFKVLGKNSSQPRILSLAKLFFENEGEIEIF